MAATAREIMARKLITIRDIDTLAVAHRMMKNNKIRHLPVENDAGDIIGVLSHRDIMRASESNISYEYGSVFEDLKIGNHLMVEDFMSSPVESVLGDTPLKLVAEKMLNNKISCYLVRIEGEIAGIVTTDDLLRYLVFMLDGETKASMVSFLFTDQWQESFV
jgi:CBS domain-containing membrane protein